MPTLAQVIAKINSDITANGNEEITGLVLNSVLLDIVAQINDLTGKLEDLNTDDVTSIVNAIKSLKQELDDFINSQTGALVGTANPNEETPVGFDGRVGTIYLKMITVGVQTTPESYWIYTGINDIGWLNLTADDTFKMVIVDHYEDLPAQGQTNRIYFVQDENNTYIWNVNIFPNDYVLVGGVVNGEYIDDTTFNDEFGSPVVPDTGNLYLDTVTGKYYRWDGNYFLPIDQDTGGTIPTISEVLAEGNALSSDNPRIDFYDDNSGNNGEYFIGMSPDTSNTAFYRQTSSRLQEVTPTGFLNYKPEWARTLNITIQDDGLLINDQYNTVIGNFKGIVADKYYGANYTDYTYVQKKYVDDNFLPLPTEGTSGQVLTTDGAGEYTWENAGADYSSLTDSVLPKKSSGTNALEDSKITDTATGVSVDGRTDTDLVIEKAVNATGITTAYAIDLGAGAGNFNLTLSGATDFSLSNMIVEGQSCVFTLIINNPGENAFQFPIWLKEDPDSDEASTLDRVTIHIHKGGVSPDGTYHIKNL